MLISADVILKSVFSRIMGTHPSFYNIKPSFFLILASITVVVLCRMNPTTKENPQINLSKAENLLVTTQP